MQKGDDIAELTRETLTEEMTQAKLETRGDKLLYGNRQCLSILSELDNIRESLARLAATNEQQDEKITALEEELYSVRSREKANPQGLSLFSRLDELEASQSRLSANTKKQDERITAQDEKIDDLARELNISRSREQADSLARKAFRDIRHRFLDAFRRRPEPIEYNSARIRLGNAVAHGANCVADADLYRSERQDYETYRYVYGVCPSTVQELGKASSLSPPSICCSYAYFASATQRRRDDQNHRQIWLVHGLLWAPRQASRRHCPRL
jgi:hypothetical protein